VHTPGSEGRPYTVKRLKPGATLEKTGGTWRPENDEHLPWEAGREYQGQTKDGRWPANVVMSHTEACGDACADGCPVAELDRQSGFRRSGERPAAKGIKSAPGQGGTMGGGWTGSRQEKREVLDEGGGASRFFPVFRYQAKAPAAERPKIDGKGWPTVKPQGLMRWLVRLVTPPGGVVLDPFAGTGTTLQAARDEGFASIGIERDEFAYRLACQRLGLDDDPEAAA